MRVVLAIALALAVGIAGAAAPTAPVSLPFATLDTGSAWYVYGATLAELLRKTLPPGSTVDVKPRAAASATRSSWPGTRRRSVRLHRHEPLGL